MVCPAKKTLASVETGLKIEPYQEGTLLDSPFQKKGEKETELISLSSSVRKQTSCPSSMSKNTLCRGLEVVSFGDTNKKSQAVEEHKQSDHHLPWFIAKDDQRLLVVFRGSASARDFLQDIKLFQKDVNDYNFGKDCTFETVKNLVQANPSLEVHCAGHSLGGAMAQIECFNIAKRLGIKTVVWSYGAPRIASSAFAKDFKQHVYHFRFRNEVDRAPTLPSIGYTHADTFAVNVFGDGHFVCMDDGNFDEKGVLGKIALNFRTLKSHLVKKYLDSLEAVVKKL